MLTAFWLRAVFWQVNDDLIIAQVIQQQPRPLLQHIWIDALRTQERHPVLPALPFRSNLIRQNLRLAQLLAEPLIGQKATVALYGVEGKIGYGRHSQCLRDCLTEPVFDFFEQLHAARESCSDSGVKGKKSRERYLSAGRTACIALPVSTSLPFCWFLFKGACAVCAPARLRYLRGTAERQSRRSRPV